MINHRAITYDFTWVGDEWTADRKAAFQRAADYIAGFFVVPRSRGEHGVSLDPIGAVLSAVGLGTVVFALACVDVAWQRFQFTKRNMMTKQEVEDERRRSEGDPTMKMRQRRARKARRERRIPVSRRHRRGPATPRPAAAFAGA